MVKAPAKAVPGDDQIRSEATNLSHQLFAQLNRIFDKTIRVAEEHTLFDTQDCGRAALFFSADRRQLTRRHAGLVGALVAIRDEHIGDFPSLGAPAPYGTGAEKLSIVRVGDNYQCSSRALVQCKLLRGPAEAGPTLSDDALALANQLMVDILHLRRHAAPRKTLGRGAGGKSHLPL